MSVLSDNVGYATGLNRKEFSYSIENFPTASVAQIEFFDG